MQTTAVSPRFGGTWTHTLIAASPALLYAVRLWASVCLALFVAFWLELDNPYWAGTSAAAVCQPQLGASLRKGWFRMIGTVAGAVVIVLLTACFPQDRIGFLGLLALWGFSNNNTLGTTSARNAEIYQWNLGVQHLFPGGITIGADYSGSQSRHLPFSSGSRTGNHNFLSSSIRNQIVADYNACAPACETPTNVLNDLVDNPFLPLFQGPSAIFNEPTSIYSQAQIPRINLLRPFPQFDGQFS